MLVIIRGLSTGNKHGGRQTVEREIQQQHAALYVVRTEDQQIFHSQMAAFHSRPSVPPHWLARCISHGA